MCVAIRAMENGTRNVGVRGHAKQNMGSKAEVKTRMTENESDKGDHTMSTKIEQGMLVLKCDVCLVFVNANKQLFSRHLSTEKHVRNLQKKKKELLEHLQLKDLFSSWREKNPTAAGCTIDVLTDQFRLETIAALMTAGIPLAKLDALRPFLEKWTKLSLCGSSHISQYIPFISEECVKAVMDAIRGHLLCCIFDGSTRVYGVMAMLLLFVGGFYDSHLAGQLAKV